MLTMGGRYAPRALDVNMVMMTEKTKTTMSQDINSILFKRMSPAKKLDLLEKFTPKELLSVTTDTVKRIIKEVGRKIGNTRCKELYISQTLRTGNEWNSEFEGIGCNKGKLYVILYVQYGNTDTTTCESFDKFFCKGTYVGSIEHTDRYGSPQTAHFIYYESDKARCMRRLLMQYIYLRYKDKFVKSEAA